MGTAKLYKRTERIGQMSSSAIFARVWVYGPEGRPQVKALGLPRTLIGRADHCDICIADEAVSRDHLEISLHGEVLVGADLDSLNGTVLNGRPLDRPTRIRDGDTLLIGSYRLQVELTLQPALATTVKRAPRIARLSDEELEIIETLIAPYRSGRGLAPPTRKQIAETLSMSESKVKRRIGSIAQKLGLPPHKGRDRSHLIAERVIELGLDRRR